MCDTLNMFCSNRSPREEMLCVAYIILILMRIIQFEFKARGNLDLE